MTACENSWGNRDLGAKRHQKGLQSVFATSVPLATKQMEPWHLLGTWDGFRSTSSLSLESRIPRIWELKSHNIPQTSLPCAMYLFSLTGFILYPFHPLVSYWTPAVLEASACVLPNKLYTRSMLGTRQCSSRGYSSPRAYFPNDPRCRQGPPCRPFSGELTASICLALNSCSLCQALKWVRENGTTLRFMPGEKSQAGATWHGSTAKSP